MVQQFLIFFFTIRLVTSGLPNKLTLYLKDAELLAVKSTLLSGGSSRLY